MIPPGELPPSQPPGPMTRSKKQRAEGALAEREVKLKADEGSRKRILETREPEPKERKVKRLVDNDQLNFVKLYLHSAAENVAKTAPVPTTYETVRRYLSPLLQLFGQSTENEHQVIVDKLTRAAEKLQTARDLGPECITSLLELKGKLALTPQLALVVNTLELLPQEEQPQALIQMISGLDSLPHEELFEGILNTIRKTPQESRLELIKLFPSAFHGLDLIARGAMIYSLYEVNEVPLLAQVLPLLQDIDDADKRAAMLLSVQGMTPSQATEYLPHFSRLCVGTTLPVIFVVNMRKIALEQRIEAVAQALPLVENLSDETRYHFWEHYCQLDSTKRGELCNIMHELCHGIRDLEQREAICQSLTRLSSEELRAAYQTCRPLLEVVPNGMLRASILQFATAFPSEDFTAMADQLRNISDENELQMRLRAIASRYQSEEGFYTMHLKRDELEKIPGVVLNRLTDRFIQSISDQLNITFEGEAGIDAGGLGRQFICDLFKGVLKSMQGEPNPETGLYRPKGNSDVYEKLGKVMMFCLNAAKNYPTGILFDDGVFGAIVAFLKTSLEKPFERLTYEELFTVYEALQFSEPEMLSHMRNATDDEKREIYEEQLIPSLAPIYAIAKGMKNAPFITKLSWQDVAQLEPNALSRRLQGVLSRDKILEKLKFAPSIAAEQKDWLNSWLRNAEIEKIKQFLYILTGASSIGNVTLEIDDNSQNESAPFLFHSCARVLEVPFQKLESEEQFVAALEASLTGQAGFNRV